MSTTDDDWRAVARLLRRTGFGATGPEIDAAIVVGPAAYLLSALTADQQSDPGVVATPAPALELLGPVGKQATAAERKAHNAALQDGLAELTRWWLRRMVAVRQPLTEKMTFCWHNHFATSRTKVRQAALLLQQNETLRTHSRGNFRTLAQAMLIDPAMLIWLDGNDNVAGAPNENLSREFIELFTLGHGDGYTEQDVREGARALTGWRLTTDGGATLNSKKHDSTAKTILGVTGNLDQTGFGDAVLAQPAAGPYVARRTYGQLISDNPPSEDVLAALTRAFQPSWDIGALLTAMLGSADFVAAQGTSVINPVEWLVGALRALQVPLTDDKRVRTLLATLDTLGQVPFDPPSVGGWPSGAAWLSTAAADTRIRAAVALTKIADLDSISAAAPSERVDAAGHLLGVAAWSARSRAVLNDAAGDPRQLVAIALNTSEYLTN